MARGLSQLIVVLYVDDVLIGSQNTTEITKIKNVLGERFKVKVLVTQNITLEWSLYEERAV